MEEVLVAILKGGEVAADFCATFYERLVSDDADDDQEDPSSTDETR